MGQIERHNIEYKESWSDEYLKWICGFANASGGSIFIGLDDNGKPQKPKSGCVTLVAMLVLGCLYVVYYTW